ncbi:MAG: recombinase family protein [Dehalococcoidia bacterium]
MKHDKETEVMSRDQLDGYIDEAAKAAGYEDGFGVKSCDLMKPTWWAAYVRQSLVEQAQNNRIPEYLLTCARMAKQRALTVPQEYIVVDHESSEYLDRKNMAFLRKELIAKRRIQGVLIPLQGRLTMDPGQQLIFERECTHYGVEFVFGDVPSGADWASSTSRLIMAKANALRVQTNRDSARAGNIGRVLKGMVPASRAAYGYRYKADREIAPDGKVIIKRAWWELDESDPDGQLIYPSPAWVVIQIFTWVGSEGLSLFWVANKLNEMGIKAPDGGKWSPAGVSAIVRHHCYTGTHYYNANARVPNPDRPLVDITAEIKRTLLRPKPKDDWVEFKVPTLVSEELWQKANATIAQRGRGRGKQGKTIQALLRNRIYCPRCCQPMVVRRAGHLNGVYYYCSRYFKPWVEHPCNYRKFVPGTWDQLVWQDICSWLRTDAWVEQQLSTELLQDENVEKLLRLQLLKTSQAEARITKVQEGFEGGLYNRYEAKMRIDEHRATIAKAEKEIKRLREELEDSVSGCTDLEALREELKVLRDSNLDGATFEERLDVISKLGIKVYPSEDLKTMRVSCQLNLGQVQSDIQSDKVQLSKSQADEECELATKCRKVMNGSAYGILGI